MTHRGLLFACVLSEDTEFLKLPDRFFRAYMLNGSAADLTPFPDVSAEVVDEDAVFAEAVIGLFFAVYNVDLDVL